MVEQIAFSFSFESVEPLAGQPGPSPFRLPESTVQSRRGRCQRRRRRLLFLLLLFSPIHFQQRSLHPFRPLAVFVAPAAGGRRCRCRCRSSDAFGDDAVALGRGRGRQRRRRRLRWWRRRRRSDWNRVSVDVSRIALRQLAGYEIRQRNAVLTSGTPVCRSRKEQE